MDPNLLNQLLQLLNLHAQMVNSQSAYPQPTDYRMMQMPSMPIDTNYLQPVTKLSVPRSYWSQDPYGSTGPFFPQKPSLPPSIPYGGDVINPQYPGGYGNSRVSVGPAAPPAPYDPNYWAGTPGPSKWSLGPGGGTSYNDVLQRYNGYVPPTPTGKISVRPMQPQFVRDPYAGRY